MTIFTVGVQLLKLKRATIPRDVVAPWWQVILAFILVVTALFANIKYDEPPTPPSRCAPGCCHHA